MGKKCIPGVICIENMTLFILIVISIMVIYLYYVVFIKQNSIYNTNNNSNEKIIVLKDSSRQPVISPNLNLFGLSTRKDPFNDPYSPPMQNDTGVYYPPDFGDIRGVPGIGVPIQMQSRGINSEYQQIGILTRDVNMGGELILPLFGRRTMTGRDKWQYYTISNTGTLNTKLPVSVNGKSCTSELGCDMIYNNDSVFVEGYKDVFRATIYENNLLRYLPF
jgi:hypothetical protein